MRVNKRLEKIIALILISTFSTAAGYLLAPIEVRFINTLTQNNILIGFTFSIGALFMGFFSWYLGRLSVRFGKKRLITFGTLVSIIYPLFYANTYNVFQYMGVKLAWAFAVVATGSILMALFQDLLVADKRKGKYMSVLFASQALVGSFGSLLGSVVADQFSLRTTYYVLALMMVLPAMISLKFVGFRDKVRYRKKSARSILFSVNYIFERPLLKYLLLLDIGFLSYWYMKPIIFPLIIFGMSGLNTTTGLVFATMGIVATVFLPIAGHISDKKGFELSINIAYVVLGISSFLLAFATQLWMFWLFAAIFSIGEAFSGPPKGVIQIENIKNKYRGEVIGMFWLIYTVIGVVVPAVVGFLMNNLTYQKILFLFSIIIWIFYFVALLIYGKHTKTKKIKST